MHVSLSREQLRGRGTILDHRVKDYREARALKNLMESCPEALEKLLRQVSGMAVRQHVGASTPRSADASDDSLPNAA